jgi:hypothetical protein
MENVEKSGLNCEKTKVEYRKYLEKYGRKTC